MDNGIRLAWQRLAARRRVTDQGCWVVPGRNADKYLSVKVGRSIVSAHRLAYRALIGEVPTGLQLDHLCRVRGCFNPAHLEPVTQRENILRGEAQSAQRARQTSCTHGHPLTTENTYVRPNGQRVCRPCKNASSRATYQRRAMAT